MKVQKEAYYHAVVDCYSRLCYFDSALVSNADSMLDTLKNAIEFFGDVPESVQGDNGTENKNNKMTQFCKDNNIEIIYSTPGKPQQNGKIERWNGTFKRDLKNKILNNSDIIKTTHWDQHLDPEFPNMTPSGKLTLGEYSREHIYTLINNHFDRNLKRFEQRRNNFKSLEVGTIVAVH
ncbi:hypothetical protein ACTFIT_009738 [Dictyostelium discoideum]